MSDLTVKIEIGDDTPENCHIEMGGDSSNPTWEEYISDYRDEWQKYIKLIRKAIEDSGLLGIKADNFCNNHYFQFSDGESIAFTWRAWGDIMQAIIGKREGYMKYYM